MLLLLAQSQAAKAKKDCGTESLNLHPVRWTSAVKLDSLQNIDEILAQPVAMPDDMELTLTRNNNDGSTDHLAVKTGKEWLDARSRGFYAYSTYDMTAESWFDHSAGTLALLRKARPARRSYVADVNLDGNALRVLPVTLHPSWMQNLRMACEQGQQFPGMPADWAPTRDGDGFTTCGPRSPRFADLYPGATVSNVSPCEIMITQGNTEFGMQISLTLAAWGDFNGNGTEDILAEYASYYLHGSGRFYGHVLFSRLSPDGTLEEVRFDTTTKNLRN